MFAAVRGEFVGFRLLGYVLSDRVNAHLDEQEPLNLPQLNQDSG